MGDWVVTYRIGSAQAVGVCLTIAEFYRGSQEECERIKTHYSCGSDDRIPTVNPWQIIIGPASDWDKFLKDG